MGRKSPDEEHAEFLAKHPSWVQKMLQLNYALSPEEHAAWVATDPQLKKFHKIEEDYQRIIRRVPSWWKAYNRRLLQNPVIQWLLPLPAPPGRPRRDDLAREAKALRRKGKSWDEIALLLRDKYTISTKKGIRQPTPEGIRKLVGPRKHSTSPDKTQR
jgi:hypothetical protein